MRVLLVVMALAVGGCGAAILKSPIVSECERAGLRGCEAMTDGILLVVEGDKEGGLKKVAAGAADNAPDDLKKFLVALKALRAIPGADQYMGPVFEVIDYLEKATPKTVARADADVVVEHGEKPDWGIGGPPHAAVMPDHLVTADTDPKQLGGGAVVPAVTGNKRRKCDGPTDAPSTCVAAVAGPLVITTLMRTADACRGVFVGVRDGVAEDDSFDWQLAVERDVVGRLYVPQGKLLVVGAARGDAACGVLWFGFRPYAERD